MPAIRVEDAAIWVDQQRIPFFAGEVHYWRLAPARWDEVLAAVRRLGLRVVATYVPWQYHELAPGDFDFTGRTEPQRDLVGFLGLLAQRDFWVFIRPGPYIYSEWTNAGVPDRVVHLPRLGEEYRREARVWMRAVAEVLRPHQATHGGRVVLFQPDNEMDLFSHWFEEPSGLDGRQPGFFQQFLAQAYPDIAALNAAWGTHYAGFAEAQPLAARLSEHERGALTRHKDYWRFQHWATAEGIRWHADEYRRLGIDVPQLANYYPGGDVQNWREVAKVVEHIGIDWYPRNEFGHDADEHRKFLDTCRYQRALTPLPCIAEFECGVWHGFHDYVGVLTPNHYRLMACSALLAGIQGWNWYMLAGRDNWYYCPVNERGELRPELAEVFMDLHRVVADLDPPTLRKLTSACVLLEPVQIGTDRVLTQNRTLHAMYDADADFEVFDPEVGGIARPVMFYAATDWLSAASQARLVQYMESGGTLVLCQQYPQRDDQFRPHNGLGVAPPDRILSNLGKKVEIALGPHPATVEGAVWNWDNPPGEPLRGTQVAGRQQAVENADKWMVNYIGRQWVCGYRQPRGRGALVVLGLPINAAIVRAVHRWLDLPLYAQPALSGVQTALFTRANAWFLVATNTNPVDVQTRVTLDGVALPARVAMLDLWSRDSEVQERAQLTLNLARYSGGVWRLGAAP